VSYALAVAADARADLRRIEPWLQEEVWDELELIAADTSVLTPTSSGDSEIHSFNRVSGGMTHYVVIALVRNDATKTITVLGVTDEPIAGPSIG
jgi:hypothetical protein